MKAAEVQRAVCEIRRTNKAENNPELWSDP